MIKRAGVNILQLPTFKFNQNFNYSIYITDYLYIITKELSEY